MIPIAGYEVLLNPHGSDETCTGGGIESRVNRLLNPHGSDETRRDGKNETRRNKLLNPHGSDETALNAMVDPHT